jgi:hypothetical protein
LLLPLPPLLLAAPLLLPLALPPLLLLVPPPSLEACPLEDPQGAMTHVCA